MLMILNIIKEHLLFYYSEWINKNVKIVVKQYGILIVQFKFNLQKNAVYFIKYFAKIYCYLI